MPAYGSGELLERLDGGGVHNGIKCQPPPAPKGHFPKDRFVIDLDGRTVTCPLAAQCTTAHDGRTITIGPHEARVAAARIRQADPAWKADYQATRPEVERKIGHLMRRRDGGRRARVRGQLKVAADFALLAAAVNLARLGVLGVAHRNGVWAADGG
jgi:hypothetical protein